MSNTITRISRENLPDVIENLGNVTYMGYFNPHNREGENCLIIRVQEEGNITTRMYANGINFDSILDWEKRKEYTYRYAIKSM